jgi:hypothetical protein
MVSAEKRLHQAAVILRFVMKGIDFEILSDFKVNVEINLGQTELRKRGVKFLDLRKAQKEQLKHFMRVYAVGNGPL